MMYSTPQTADNYLLFPAYRFLLQPPKGKQQIAGNIKTSRLAYI